MPFLGFYFCHLYACIDICLSVSCIRFAFRGDYRHRQKKNVQESLILFNCSLLLLFLGHLIQLFFGKHFSSTFKRKYDHTQKKKKNKGK